MLKSFSTKLEKHQKAFQNGRFHIHKSFNLILFEQEKRDKDNANKARKYHKMKKKV